jgi:hypothetical protein
VERRIEIGFIIEEALGHRPLFFFPHFRAGVLPEVTIDKICLKK